MEKLMDMEQFLATMRRCEFIYGRSCGIYNKGDQCLSQAKEAKEYCALHLAVMRNRNLRNEADKLRQKARRLDDEYSKKENESNRLRRKANKKKDQNRKCPSSDDNSLERPRKWARLSDGVGNKDQDAPSTSTTAAEERVEEDHPRVDEEPEQQVEEPMERDIVEPQSNEHDALDARLEAELDRLRTEHEAELTRRSIEQQRELDELKRACEEGEKRCHDQEDQMHAVVVTRQLIDDVERNELIEQLRVANDDRAKILEENRRLEESLDEEARRKSQISEENEIKIRSITNELEALHSQLNDAKRDQRTLQAALDTSSRNKNEMEKNILSLTNQAETSVGQLEKAEREMRTLQAKLVNATMRKNEIEKTLQDLEKSNRVLVAQLNEQGLRQEQLKDALRKLKSDNERSDHDYKALKTEMERAIQVKETEGEEIRRGLLEKIRHLEEEIKNEAGLKKILAELEMMAQVRANETIASLRAQIVALKVQTRPSLSEEQYHKRP